LIEGKESTSSEPRIFSTLPRELVTRSVQANTGDDLVTIFLKEYWPERYADVTRDYCLVAAERWNEKQPLFWYISDQGLVHSGKMMRYRLREGEPEPKRTKFTYNSDNFYWLHSPLLPKKAEVKNPKIHYNFKPCLYGAHLVKKYPDKPVHIVEGEKTALAMACHRPQYVWLATGSDKLLQEEYLPNLEGREVVLHPDKGYPGHLKYEGGTPEYLEARKKFERKSYGYWVKKAEEFMKKKLAASWEVSNFVQDSNLPSGSDLLDLIFKHESTK
jgi:hypothetical protein